MDYSSRLSGRRMPWRAAAVLAAAIGLSACSAAIPSALVAPPRLQPINASSAALRALPPPTARVPVAVYDFPDLTGQYNETSTGGQTLSRAVTQGGAALLISSLQNAGERRWFTVLDRQRLDDTLKERQIVTEMRRLYRGEEQISAAALPPLQHASIIIEGGITGYDTYVKTGGLGAQYLGIGGNTKWQQDTVTVSLRAVSAKTSEVLLSVTVQKPIASVSLQGNVFRYVALDKILEIESGVTTNEPRQIAVEQAIDKAVNALVIEGAHVGIWKFANKLAGQVLIEDYLKEKYGEDMPANAVNPVPPATRNAAALVKTVPVSLPKKPQPQTSQSTPPPATGTVLPPPPPQPDETVG